MVFASSYSACLPNSLASPLSGLSRLNLGSSACHEKLKPPTPNWNNSTATATGTATVNTSPKV
jgi:hypothetical protein